MAEEQFFKDKPQTSIIAQIVHRYMPFWPIFVLLTLIALAIAFVYLRSQTKIYVSAAKVLLIDPQKGGADSKVLEAMNIFSEKKIVENEIIVLRSSDLIKKVVNELDLYVQVFNDGNVQTEELYAENSPLKFVAVDKDSINGGGKYYFDMDWKKSIVKINGQQIPFNGILNINGTAYRLEVNPEYNRNVTGKKFYAVFNSPGAAAGGIIGSLRIAPQSYASTVLDLKIETPVPKKGIHILNKLFELYNIAGVQDKNRIADTTLRFIDERLNTVLAQLDSVERNIQNYKARNSIADLGS
ncbi:MAG TPA: Wzz/FepE/Etk N-terminal domain-containing protein, partial [Cyclobacteriaceae bacterium]|nr:Wzz/FepE/Etk N-terminal domain-containing protein [Cyclobacteriaceae bacterium]